jgi:hypothetical protein
MCQLIDHIIVYNFIHIKTQFILCFDVFIVNEGSIIHN